MSQTLHDKLNSAKAVMGIYAMQIKEIVDKTSSLDERDLARISVLASQIVTAKVEYCALQGF